MRSVSFAIVTGLIALVAMLAPVVAADASEASSTTVLLGTVAPLTGRYRELAACPDSPRIAALRHEGGAIDVLEVVTGERVATLDRRFMNELIAFPSAEAVLAADAGGVWRIPLDPGGVLTRILDAPERGEWERTHVAASQDGHVLVLTESQDAFAHHHPATRLRVVEPARPGSVRELPFDPSDLTHGEPHVHARMSAGAVSGDGGIVVAFVSVVRELDEEGTIEELPGALLAWDASSGRPCLQRRIDPEEWSMLGFSLTHDGKILLGSSLIDPTDPEHVTRIVQPDSATLHVSHRCLIDDHTLLLVTADRLVEWDCVRGEVVRTSPTPVQWYPQAACATRAAGIVIADQIRLRVFDPQTLAERWQPVGHDSAVERLAFLPGDQLLSLGRDAIVWDLGRRAPLRRGAVATSFTFAVDPDGTGFLINDDHYQTQIVTVATLAPIGEPGACTQAVAWPQSDRAIGVWESDDGVEISEGVPPQRIGTMPRAQWRGCADISADGSRVFACNDDHIFLYDLRTRRQAWTLPLDATRGVLSGDGALLAVGVLTEDAAVRLVDTATGDQVGSLPISSGNILDATWAFAAHQPRVAVAQRSGDVVVSDIRFNAGVAQAVEAARFRVGIEPRVVAWSTDARQIAVGGADGRIAIVSLTAAAPEPTEAVPP